MWICLPYYLLCNQVILYDIVRIRSIKNWFRSILENWSNDTVNMRIIILVRKHHYWIANSKIMSCHAKFLCLGQNFYIPMKVKMPSIDNRSRSVNVIWKSVRFCNLSSFEMIHAFKFQHFIAIITIDIPNFLWSKKPKRISHPCSLGSSRMMMYDWFTNFLNLRTFI